MQTAFMYRFELSVMPKKPINLLNKIVPEKMVVGKLKLVSKQKQLYNIYRSFLPAGKYD